MDPAGGEQPPFGTYAAVGLAGGHLLATEAAARLTRLGAQVERLEPVARSPAHWGSWFVAAVRRRAETVGPIPPTIGYLSAGALALAHDDALAALLSAAPGEAVVNNRFSCDAFVVSGDPEATLAALEGCETDNAAARNLESGGYRLRDLSAHPWSRFDVDTPLDLALLRAAAGLPGMRRTSAGVAAFLEMARLPGDRELAIPNQERIGTVVRDRGAELLVAGRIPAGLLVWLESETACRVRALVEERGMRSARGIGRPRSLLARTLERDGAEALVAQLASLADAVILDTRVLMASLGGSADAAAWPPAEERFASDFGDHRSIGTRWLAQLTEAAAAAAVPFLLGGHSLVSDGLRIPVAAAWAGH